MGQRLQIFRPRSRATLELRELKAIFGALLGTHGGSFPSSNHASRMVFPTLAVEEWTA